MKPTWFKSGSPWIWLNAGAISICITLLVGLLFLIAGRGLHYFWPKNVLVAEYQTPGKPAQLLIGEIHDRQLIPAARLKGSGVSLPDQRPEYLRLLIKSNRHGGANPYQTYLEVFLRNSTHPAAVTVIEQRTGGNFFGFIDSVKHDGRVYSTPGEALTQITQALQRASELHAKIYYQEKNAIGRINHQKKRLDLAKIKLDYYKSTDTATYAKLKDQHTALDKENEKIKRALAELSAQIKRDVLILKTLQGEKVEISFAEIIRVYQPNSMSVFGKTSMYFAKFWEFLTDDPREANTEGGIFPAIFGTVVMVILMSIFVTPLGVIAAIYLREYAHQGALTRLVRISVNNLAGVPSIVYGVFGLAFFVYDLGGTIDRFFYPELVGYKSTFGQPALIWASLTLALLTLPVVIVATEEGLSRVPRAIREGSLALGATKAETLWRTVLPMASPAMMTGLILAIARAAGEVAPLMLVGVVKYSPAAPIDFNAPFIHFDRAIMHLGYHIHDVGFQSPNAEAAQPLVYATALVLVTIIVLLNLTAIAVRNRLRERYRSMEH